MFNKNIELEFQNAVFSPLSVSSGAIMAKWYKPGRNGLYLGLSLGVGKTSKTLVITWVIPNITLDFELHSMLWVSKDH